jgi:hypothetical protein
MGTDERKEDRRVGDRINKQGHPVFHPPMLPGLIVHSPNFDVSRRRCMLLLTYPLALLINASITSLFASLNFCYTVCVFIYAIKSDTHEERL